jgi:hypothetical protein
MRALGPEGSTFYSLDLFKRWLLLNSIDEIAEIMKMESG